MIEAIRRRLGRWPCKLGWHQLGGATYVSVDQGRVWRLCPRCLSSKLIYMVEERA